MKKAFRESLKRQAALGYLSNSFRSTSLASRSINERQYQDEIYIETPILWQALARKYQFNYPNDWYKIEAHWLDQIESFQEQPIDCPGRDGESNNAITRISQCNESYQLCNSLPRSFIVPKDLKDVTLMNVMSTVIKDHRVPIISYCCPVEYCRNFIIRCASSDQQTKVIETLNKVVKPLKVLDLSSMAPSSVIIEKAHKKLRNICRPSGDIHGPAKFISKSGSWLSIVSQALKLAREATRSLLKEGSVLLIEENDRGWNCLVSSLVQLLLEPSRRTVNGLESLISKEWIYLAGGQRDDTVPDVYFSLFLDCIYQIYLQNTAEFEFTSEYLRYLFEAQYMSTPSPNSSTPDIRCKLSEDYLYLDYNSNHRKPKSNGIMRRSLTTPHTDDRIKANNNRANTDKASYKASSLSMVEFSQLPNCKNNQTFVPPDIVAYFDNGYTAHMFSPFYTPNKDSPIVDVNDYVAKMKLWSSLYLRWEPRIAYGCLEEVIHYELDTPVADD